MKIGNERVVSIHYRLSGEGGEEIDASEPGSPFAYLHGADNIVPGLERELEGKAAGDRVQVTVQPEDGYGPLRPELVRSVPRSAFAGIDEIEPGMQFETQGDGGERRLVTVRSVDRDTVTIDGNHPLAGRVLHFEVTVEAVRVATPEELDHGHVH